MYGFFAAVGFVVCLALAVAMMLSVVEGVISVFRDWKDDLRYQGAVAERERLADGEARLVRELGMRLMREADEIDPPLPRCLMLAIGGNLRDFGLRYEIGTIRAHLLAAMTGDAAIQQGSDGRVLPGG